VLSNSNISKVFRGDFLKFWIGQLISNFGDNFFYMGLMAIILYRMHLNAGYLGLLMVMMAIPTLIFGPIAGSYVDRWNRKHTMIVADILRGFIVLSLLFYSELWYIYASIFMLATVSRFFYPAEGAIIPDIVEKDVLMSANSFSQTTYILSSILGPGIGAAMVGILGINSVFIFDGLSFFISALSISLIRYSGEIKEKGEKGSIWAETVEGMRYAKNNRVIRVLMIFIFVLLLFFGGMNSLYMVFVRDVLHMDLFYLGLMESLNGTGSLIASIFVGVLGGALSKKNMVLGASLTIGASMVILTLFPNIFIAFETMAFFGVSMVLFNTPITTLMQEAAPDSIRGRVFGSFGAIMQVAMLSSMAVETSAADIFGVKNVLFAIGIGVMLFTIAFFSVKNYREVFEIGNES